MRQEIAFTQMPLSRAHQLQTLPTVTRIPSLYEANTDQRLFTLSTHKRCRADVPTEVTLAQPKAHLHPSSPPADGELWGRCGESHSHMWRWRIPSTQLRHCFAGPQVSPCVIVLPYRRLRGYSCVALLLPHKMLAVLALLSIKRAWPGSSPRGEQVVYSYPRTLGFSSFQSHSWP